VQRILRFLVSGGTTTLLNVLILYIAVEWLGIWYIFGAILSFTVAILLNFAFQRVWVFQNASRKDLERHLVQFFAIAICGTLVNIFMLYILVEQFGMPYLLAQLFAIALLSIINFFLYQRILSAVHREASKEVVRP
jgi:putative flippase GtrA